MDTWGALYTQEWEVGNAVLGGFIYTLSRADCAKMDVLIFSDCVHAKKFATNEKNQ